MTSVQLARYLQERADGKSVEEACFWSGIGFGEAALHENDIEAGELELPRARAHAREQAEEEKAMSRGDIAADELRLLIERVERLREEIKALNDNVSDVFKEAKSRGFDTATMKRVIKIRGMEPHALQEADALLESYLDALGMTLHSIALAA